MDFLGATTVTGDTVFAGAVAFAAVSSSPDRVASAGVVMQASAAMNASSSKAPARALPPRRTFWKRLSFLACANNYGTMASIKRQQRGLSLGPATAAVKACLDAKPRAVAAPIPSAPSVLVYKIMGKMFAILTTRRVPNVILKCDPHLAEIMREQFAGVGHRSHLDRRFWISVTLDADVPVEEIERLATHSYDLVCAKLTRKQRVELAAASPTDGGA